jgi:branched-chain amino acid transport system substrate-binding protein
MRFSKRTLAWSLIATLAACQPAGSTTAPTSSTGPTAAPSATTASTAATGGDTIKVAALFPLSGDNAAFGNDGLAAAQIAAEFFNQRESAGIGGKKVEIVPVDVTTPEQAQSEAQRVITQQGIKVLTGTTLSLLGLPASAAADRLGALYFDAVDASPQISGRKLKLVFQMAPHGDAQGAVAGAYAGDQVAKALGKAPADIKVGIIYANDAYSSSVGQGASAKAKELGLNIVVEEAYDPGITDMSPLILKLKAAGVEVLLGSQLGPDAILLNKQSRQLDFNPVVISALGYDNPDAVKALGDCVNGILMSSFPQFSAIDPAKLSEEGRSLAVAYGPAWKAKTGRETSVDSDSVFNGVWVLLKHVMQPVGSNDPTALAAQARTLDLPIGSLANGWGVKFDGDQYNGRSVQSVNQYQAQKQVLVYPDTFTHGQLTMVPRPAWSTVCK